MATTRNIFRIILFLEVFLLKISAQWHQVTPLTSHAGVYFENIGKVHQSTANWEFFLYLNISSLYTDSNLLERYYEDLEKLCIKAKVKFPEDNCVTANRLIKSTLFDIREVNEHFASLTGGERSRQKRGLMNIIGKAQKFLFGVMDSDDSEHIEGTIKTLAVNQANIHHSLDKKISVIVDTIQSSFTSLNMTFNNISKSLNGIEKELEGDRTAQKNFHLLDEATNTLMFAANRILANQAEYLDIIQEARVGRLDKHLTKSEYFLKALTDIQIEKLDDLKFPAKPTHYNIPLIARVSTITPLLTANSLVLQIKIPLVKNSFSLYKIASVPSQFQNNTYYYVKVDSQYVLIDETRERYSFLNQGDLESCTLLQVQEFVCSQNFVSYLFNKANCIIGLHQGEIAPADCEIRLFNLTHEIWNALSKANTWIYLIPTLSTLRINCNGSAISTSLIGSGLLSLEPGCKARTKEVSLETHTTISRTEAVLFKLNSSPLNDLKLNLSAIPDKNQLSRVILDTRDLDTFSVKLKSIIADPEPLNYTLGVNTYQLIAIPTSIFSMIFVAVLIYLTCRKYFKCTLSLCPADQRNNQEHNEQTHHSS